MLHLRSICAPFVLQLRSAVFPERIRPVFFDVKQFKVFGIVGCCVSVFLDGVMHTPVLDYNDTVFKSKYEAFCNQYPQIINACADILCNALRITYEPVIICPQTQMEI